MSRIDSLFRAIPKGARTTPVDANGVPCEWVCAGQIDSDRVLMYIHGGGFCLHLPRLYANFAADLSARLNARVLLVDYRLAPEHPFPAAPNDCLTAYRWLLQQPGVDPARLAIAGDSAGGNLSLVTLLQAKQEGLPLAPAAWLLSPGVDCDWAEEDLPRLQKTDPMFSVQALELMNPYFATADRSDYRVSPVKGDLRGLPPVLIEAGQEEMLRGQPELFARQARKAGVVVTSRLWQGMPHVFQLFSFLPEAKRARRQGCRFLENHMAGIARQLRETCRSVRLRRLTAYAR